MTMPRSLPARDPVLDDAAHDFADFYRRTHLAMLRLAFVLIRSQADAEDAVQEAFVRLHSRWSGLENPTAYLRRTVVNLCHDHHRRSRRETGRAAAVTGVTDSHPDELWDALGTLAARRRAVLVLRFYLDLTEAETADALGCRPGTVKSLTHRALADLRRVIER